MVHTEYEIVIPLLIPWMSRGKILYIEIQWSVFSTLSLRIGGINIKIGEKKGYMRSMFIV